MCNECIELKLKNDKAVECLTETVQLIKKLTLTSEKEDLKKAVEDAHSFLLGFATREHQIKNTEEKTNE